MADNTEETPFMPKSGNMFRTRDGRHGLFLEVNGRIIAYYLDNEGRYSTWNIVGTAQFQPRHRPLDTGGFEKVYEGVTQNNVAGLFPFRVNYLGKEIWSAPKVITVSLNREYTAAITEGKIRIGCQRFSLGNIKELVAKAEEAGISADDKEMY
jgi:hypothetical protein